MGPPVDFRDLHSQFVLCLSNSFGRSLSTERTADPPSDISIALFAVAFLVTSYRCFARYTKKLWGYDDSVALFSLLFFVLFMIGSYSCFGSTTGRIVGLKIFRDLRIYLSRQRCALLSSMHHRASSINCWRWITGSASQRIRIIGSYVLVVGHYTPVW